MNITQPQPSQQQPKKPQLLLYKRIRIIIALISVLVCSFNVRYTTVEVLRHSRNLHRVLNLALLQHDDLSIYWFGYRTGQYLINYPIHQYYFVQDVSQFLQRVEVVFGNLEVFLFGEIDQENFNKTTQNIIGYYSNGTVQKFEWTVKQGFKQPFTSRNIPKIKEKLNQFRNIDIQISSLSSTPDGSSPQEWDITLVLQPFSQTSIFITIITQQKINLAINHLLHVIIGICTLGLLISEIKSRDQHKIIKRNFLEKIQVSDTPDLLVAVFLIYSSFVSFLGVFAVGFVVVLDGVTCFIAWLYVLKLYTQNDDYHISFLIKKSYIFVGRLFVSFGPLFIGFVLFALTAFCRYTSLFVDFHKSFISLFCVCYYNMTYQQYRTTQKSNPISTIFFTTMIMLFTICIYSGMLVSVFCSYMWNKRQNKNKQQLISVLKIQCVQCKTKYSYQQGYQAGLQVSTRKGQIVEMLDWDGDGDDEEGESLKYRNLLRDRIKYAEKFLILIIHENLEILDQNNQHQENLEYVSKLRQWKEMIKQLIQECDNED